MPHASESLSREAVRPAFHGVLPLTPRTGILLLVVFGVVRVALVLQANVTGSYNVVSIVFVAMALLPWILLTREGRRRIGLTRPTRWWALPVALIAGAAACVVVVGVVALFWGSTLQNPFVYIGSTYSNIPADPSPDDLVISFVIYAAIGMLVSPIGEELLYRGLAHEAIASRWGHRRAAVVDAGAFAITHLAHFGVVYVAGAWSFLPVPALVWVAAMFAVSLLFYAHRRLAGSVSGAIVAHAGFNLAMSGAIFAWFLT